MIRKDEQLSTLAIGHGILHVEGALIMCYSRAATLAYEMAACLHMHQASHSQV
jgi:hypothetical protein